MADVLRLAIPPRHAAPRPRKPAASAAAPPPTMPTCPRSSGSSRRAAARPRTAGSAPGQRRRRPAGAEPRRGPGRVRGGRVVPRRAGRGRAARAPSGRRCPAGHWPGEIATAAAAAAASGPGRGHRGPRRPRPGSRRRCPDGGTRPGGAHVILSASLGPAERYRRWLAAERGQVRVVAGTRSAMFAPVADLGLVVLWDEGDDLLAEPRAPYPHAREVLALRAHRAGAAALIGGFARTAEAAQLVTGGWARPLAAERATVRRCAPAVRTAGEDSELARDEAARSARLPGLALRTAREALAGGRCCSRCRAAATWPPWPASAATPRCGATAAARRSWPASARCRAAAGAARREPQLRPVRARPPARPGHRRDPHGRGTRPGVPGRPGPHLRRQPGAGPGAGLAGRGGGHPRRRARCRRRVRRRVLLDAWALLGRPSLRAAEETLRRWMNAAALVRPGRDGGSVVVVADAALPVVQALIRWDPATFADRELAERRELRFPPAARMAALSGPHSAVRALLDAAGCPRGPRFSGRCRWPAAIPVGGRGRRRRPGQTPMPSASWYVRPGQEAPRWPRCCTPGRRRGPPARSPERSAWSLTQPS